MRQHLLFNGLKWIPESLVIWIDRLGYLIVSIGIGVLLSHAVERPFLRLRERILPSRSTRARIEIVGAPERA